ncbi:hypothetical protein AB6E19_03890 [Vibrio cyclitrophicus]
MNYDNEDMKALTQDVVEIKRKIIFELFLSTFLMFWWLGDLVFPLFYERSFSVSLYSTLIIVTLPMCLNMYAWFIWGFVGRWFGFYSSRSLEVKYRDPFERYEISLHEFSKHKNIERKIDLLVATQFIMMGVLSVFGLLMISSRVL